MSITAPAWASRTADNGDAVTRYFQARLADAAGAPERALPAYAALLDLAPGDPTIAHRAYRGAIAAGDMALALRSAHHLEAIGTLPVEARVLLFADAVKVRNWASAQASIEQLEKEDSLSFLVPILNAWVRYGMGERAVSRLLDHKSASLLGLNYAREHRVLLLLAEGRDDDALTALRALASPHGSVDLAPLHVAAAASLSSRKKWEDAASVLGQESAAAAALLAKRRKLPGAANSAAEGVSLLLMRLARDIRRQSDTPVVLTLARAAQWLSPKSTLPRILVAEIIGAQDKLDQALVLLDTIDRKDIWAVRAEDTRIAMLLAGGRSAEALSIAEVAARAPGAGVAAWTRLAENYAALGRYQETADSYDKAIALLEEQKAPVSWILWLMKGDALGKLGDWPGMRSALQRAVELGPDQPMALNYLGYAQLERRENLEAAHALIARANALRPDDAAITDSLGWAHYLRGEIPLAITLLERAVAAPPGEPTINEHLGDAYWTAGRRIDARYAWRAALVHADDETRARLEPKLDFGLTPETVAP